MELGLLEEVPGGDARSPHHRGIDLVVECLGEGRVKGGWGSGWSRGGRGGRVGGSVMDEVGGQLGKIHLMHVLSVDHRLGGVHSVVFFLDCAVSRSLDRSFDVAVQVGVGADLAGIVD
jgi:hypothetical protein